ncbi:CASP-like protein [Apostasia shenzhenica]|uniref:CASP-like protein n=1 Tax=Apostasia shenzhenica TaxID=1088818 RepID=A0A2H9ZUY8_9ASPA|nr:CASP-like protein [Apostasia shenzhenica]
MKTTKQPPEEQEVVEAADDGGAGSAVRTAEALLRIAPVGLCVTALVLTVRNSQENDYGSISYSDLGSFKYLVYVNGLCAGYSLFSAFYTTMPRPFSMSVAWAFFFLDQVLTYAMLAAGAAAAEIVYLAYNGDENVTWSRECGMFGGFCHKGAAAVGVTFGAVGCFVVLSLISSYRLFSVYDVPVPFISAGDSEAKPVASSAAASGR